MKYIWLGMIQDENDYKESCAKGWKSPAQQKVQKLFIQGLEHNYDCVFTLISACTFPPYPKYKDLFIKSKQWSHRAGANDLRVPFFNIKYISHISRTINLKKAVARWSKACQEDVICFVYSYNAPLLRAAIKLKKTLKTHHVSIVLIVPDVPLFMDPSASLLKTSLKKMEMHFLRKKVANYVDYYSVFSKPMIEYLGLPMNKSVVIEGCVDSENDDICFKKEKYDKSSDKKVFMYVGSIDKAYGIPEIIKAISFIQKPNYEIWFVGDGNCSEQLKEFCKNNKHVKYFGFISDQKELLRLQDSADVFLNLRNPNQDMAKYAFPSKVLDYLEKGKPVLSTVIEGIPTDYYKYIYTISEFSPKGLAESIEMIIDIEHKDLLEFGTTGRQFVKSYKNNYTQMGKLQRLLEGQND